MEAAHSDINSTGHMMPKNADGHPVFSAEPGLGCTFERRERVSPETPADHWTEETLVRVTHTATGKSADAPTRDEAIGRLVRSLVEGGDVSINAARRMHGLKPFDVPEAPRG